MERLLAAAAESIEDASRGREVKVMGRTSAEELIEKGIAIGEERGEERGRIAAKREMLIQLMRQKFGPIPADVESAIGGLQDPRRVDELLLRFVTATSLDEMKP